MNCDCIFRFFWVFGMGMVRTYEFFVFMFEILRRWVLVSWFFVLNEGAVYGLDIVGRGDVGYEGFNCG